MKEKHNIGRTFDFFIKQVMEWKYTQVANMMGAAPSRVNELKDGRRPCLTYRTIKKMCDVLEVDVIDFLLVHESFGQENQKDWIKKNKARFSNKDLLNAVLNGLENKC